MARKKQPVVKADARKKAQAAASLAARFASALKGKPGRVPLSPWVNVNEMALTRSQIKARTVNPFVLTEPPPGVLPKGVTARTIAKGAGIAMDSAGSLTETTSAVGWANAAVYNAAFFNGQMFAGYPYLSELAQRPEYRKISEVLAVEMTREWIELKSTAKGKDSKAEKIDQLKRRMDELDVRGKFRKMVELDGFFGRAHLYIDTGSTDDRDELKKPIGNGRDAVTKAKFGKAGFLKGLKAVEPVWCYPAFYDAIDPLKDDWYNPQQWYVQQKQMHVSRLLTFVGREVPDLLKPAYSFGGLSLSQMSKPYVDNWLRTRQSVADLTWSFSTMVLSTQLGAINQDGGQALFNRMAFFSNMRTNQGLMVVDKDTETLTNVSASLSTLDKLQAQSQEQMCSVSSTPVVKLLGIQPTGLNATAEGELTVWYEWVMALQEKFFKRHLETVIDFVQLDLWGQIDPDITFEFVPLESMSEHEEAEIQKLKADQDVALVGGGIIDPTEARGRLAADPKSGYDGLDVEQVPEGQELEEDFSGDAGSMFAGLEERPEEPEGARQTRLVAREAARQETREERLEGRQRRRDREDRRNGRASAIVDRINGQV